MLKLLHVAREEMGYQMSHWTFFITTFGLPLLVAALGVLPQLQSVTEAAPLEAISEVETVFTIDEVIAVPTGYVDHAALIQHVPEEQAANLHPFANQQAAQQALLAEEVEGYYVIAVDYIETGQVTYYSLKPQLLNPTDVPMQHLLKINLLRQLNDPRRAARLEKPVTTWEYRGPPSTVATFIETLDWPRLASAFLVLGLFSYTINIGGSLLIRSLQREVKMRVLEIMVASTTPSQFIGGKLLGLTILSLGQATLALLAAVLVYGINPDSGPAEISGRTLALIIPFLLVGFMAYSGGIMCLAVIWPNPRESGLLLGVARLVTMAPLLGVPFIILNLDGGLALGLSLFPPTAVLLMPFRILMSHVPLWQWAVSVVVASLWAMGMVGLSIWLFKRRTLLGGSSMFGVRRRLRRAYRRWRGA